REGVPAPGERLWRHAISVTDGRRKARRGDAAIGHLLRRSPWGGGGLDRCAAEERRARRNAATRSRYLGGLPLPVGRGVSSGLQAPARSARTPAAIQLRPSGAQEDGRHAPCGAPRLLRIRDA